MFTYTVFSSFPAALKNITSHMEKTDTRFSTIFWKSVYFVYKRHSIWPV